MFAKQFNVIQSKKILDLLDTITFGYTEYFVNKSIN